MKNRNIPVILLSALSLMVVIVLVWFLTRDGTDRGIVRNTGDTGGSHRDVNNEILGDSPVVGPEAKDRLAPTGAEGVGDDEATLAGEADTVRVRGTITVVDAESEEHGREDGSLLLVLWEDEDWARCHEVTVKSGSWSAEISLDVKRLGFRKPVLGGRIAMFENEEGLGAGLPIPESRFFELETRWCPDSVLYVKARDTGMDLARIEAIREREGVWRYALHPGSGEDGRVTLDLLSSPILLNERDPGDLRESLRTYFVRSPGYAWGRIGIDMTHGGDYRLDLERGGDLVVKLRGGMPEDPARLRIRNLDRDEIAYDGELGGKADWVIESLTLGHHRVSVEVGEIWENPLVLGSAEVTVQADRRSEVILDLDETPDLHMAPLKGILIAPKTLEVDSLHITFDLEGPALDERSERFTLFRRDMRIRSEDQDRTILEWDAGPVQTGRYALSLSVLGIGMEVDVTETGATDVVLEIPLLVPMTIAVVEKGTTRRLTPESLTFSAGGGIESVEPGDEGQFTFMAPLGVIELFVTCEEYEVVIREVRVIPGMAPMIIEMKRACGVRILLKDGEHSVFPESLWDAISVEPENGTGELSGLMSAQHSMTVTVSEPGRYRVRIENIKGYRAIEDLVIDVPPETILFREIRLEREK